MSMDALELSGKNVDEAIERALKNLGLSRSDVEIEVLQEGKSGILGWGGEEARVRVTPLTPASEEITGECNIPTLESMPVADIAKEVVEKLLALMNVTATVEVGEEDVQSELTIDIKNGDLGILIGRRGQALAALQFIVNFIVSRRIKGNARVMVDVAGYRKRRNEELQNLATRVADLVKSSKRSITLEPMPPAERRVIHLVLRDDPDITTQSTGYGDTRKVIVYPKRQGGII